MFAIGDGFLGHRKPRVREGTDVDEIEVGSAAKLSIVGVEFGVVFFGELSAFFGAAVRDGDDLVADFVVAVGVFVGDGACSDESDVHDCWFLLPRAVFIAWRVVLFRAPLNANRTSLSAGDEGAGVLLRSVRG